MALPPIRDEKVWDNGGWNVAQSDAGGVHLGVWKEDQVELVRIDKNTHLKMGYKVPETGKIMLLRSSKDAS